MTQATSGDDVQKWQQLRQQMQSHFSLEELRSLCFDLGVDYDLLGEKLGLAERIVRLIQYMSRNDLIEDLLAGLRQQRPAVSWPEINPDSRLPADLHSGSGQGETKYQFGDIKAAQVNVGGSQVFHGPISIDMRETASTSKTVEDNASEAGVDSDSDLATRFTRVAETFHGSPQFNDRESESFQHLIHELSRQLDQLQSTPREEIANVARRLEALSQELTAESLDADMVEIMGESLRRAAQNLTRSSPTVLTLVDQLVVLAVTARS